MIILPKKINFDVSSKFVTRAELRVDNKFCAKILPFRINLVKNENGNLTGLRYMLGGGIWTLVKAV